MTVRHSLLKRQLKRLYGDPDSLPEAWRPLLEAVDRAYEEADIDRRMLERSLELSSQELLQANAELRRERQRVEEERDNFFALSADMLGVGSVDGWFLRLNPAWERTLGWTIDELLAEPAMAFVHPDDHDASQVTLRTLAEGGTVSLFENRIRHKDGSYRRLQWTANPYPQRNVTYFAARDVTDQRHLEDQLRQAQKMEAIGRLAGGIAHDFNNLLTVIIGYSGLLQHALTRDQGPRQTVEEIKRAAARAAALTRQLLAFSRRQVLQPKVLALNAIVAQMHEMLTRLIGEDVTLLTMLAPELGLVRADPSQIDQVIVNLVLNARDAMPHGGRLAIETANVEFDRAYSARHMDIQEGAYVMLAVSDTGRGMDVETQARVFEPFFTTKGPGEGTGLGLATVYGIVKQSGGAIAVYSEPGKGSSFRIYLPRVLDATDADPLAPAEELRPIARGGGETILLVEDEDAVRRLARDVLREHGYRVLEGRNCRDAFACHDEHAGPIHLLLTDVVMPDGSGRIVAERVTAQRPETRVLYMSGYTDDMMVHHGILPTGIVLLQKPFTTTALVSKVRDVLDARALGPDR